MRENMPLERFYADVLHELGEFARRPSATAMGAAAVKAISFCTPETDCREPLMVTLTLTVCPARPCADPICNTIGVACARDASRWGAAAQPLRSAKVARVHQPADVADPCEHARDFLFHALTLVPSPLLFEPGMAGVFDHGVRWLNISLIWVLCG